MGRQPTKPSLLLPFGLIFVVGYLVYFCWAMEYATFNIWGGLLVAPVLIAITVPFVLRAGRREEDPRMISILLLGLFVKMAGTVLRYFVTTGVYSGGDAKGYHGAGAKLAIPFRDFNFFDVQIGTGGSYGTKAIRVITGLIYTITGPSMLAGFVVFSWLGFIGLFLFYRAFRIAFPKGDNRRYAFLLFFLPSVVFWPSSIGKEAWMTFTLGITAYGVARLLAQVRGGFVVMIIGLAGTALVRPHITVIIFAALFVGYLFRRSGVTSALGPMTKIAGVALLLLVGMFVIQRAEKYFHVDSLTEGGAEEVLNRAQDKSDQDDSAYASKQVSSPVDVPYAMFTVLFRPLPTEAHNVTALLASLEGVALIIVCVRSWRRLISLPRQAFRTAYLAFAACYTLLFCYAFSAISNFGIMARQRTQVFPIVMALLAAPLAVQAAKVTATRRALPSLAVAPPARRAPAALADSSPAG